MISSQLAAQRDSVWCIGLRAALILVFVARGRTAGLHDPMVTARQAESLDRGLVVVPAGGSAEQGVFLSWRLLQSDPDDVAFDVFRADPGEPEVRLNFEPVTQSTCWSDQAPRRPGAVWSVRIAGTPTAVTSSPEPGSQATCWQYEFHAIPLCTPLDYGPNDASVGDLDGDGDYDIVLHQAGRGRDNSQRGFTTRPVLQGYTLEGEFLWEINLGRNIREGAHYTQFMVYDLDGDGRAEVICRTADGTIDGLGGVIGDFAADHRNEDGYILRGDEFLTVFDGLTGAALATVPYLPPRGDVAEWGDDYGNRVDRFLACVAFLDGVRPSVVFCRGYYTRCVLVAWNWRNGALTPVWTFDSDDGTPGNRSYRGQGNHGIGVADVDADGRDEIIYGSCVIDDDGTGLYSTGLGHGDAMHVSDHDPDRPGLEVFKANGDEQNAAGLQMRDARTGEQLWGVASRGRDGVVRACAMDVDPRHRGSEAWGKGAGVDGLFDVRGLRISDRSPRTCNMGVWWDADPLRELLNGVRITKWNWLTEREEPVFDAARFDCVSINGSKANPCLCADLFGDWREEIIAASADGRELRIFTTVIPTGSRRVTLVQDPVYRLSVAWQNVSYNQPAHTGYHLGVE